MKHLSISLAIVLMTITLSNCAKLTELISEFGKPNGVEQVTLEIACDDLRGYLKKQTEPTRYLLTEQCTELLTAPLIINKPHTTILGQNTKIKARNTANTPNGFIINEKAFVLGNITLEGFTAPITVSETGSALIFDVSLNDSIHSAVLVGTSKMQYEQEQQLINNEPLISPSFFTRPNLDGFFINKAYGNGHSCNCANALTNVSNGVSVDESTTASLTLCNTDDSVNSINNVVEDPGIGIHAARVGYQGASTVQICGPTELIQTKRAMLVEGNSSIELETGALNIQDYEYFAVAIKEGALNISTSAAITVDRSGVAELCTDSGFLDEGGIPTSPTIGLVIANAREYDCTNCMTCD